MLLLGYTHFPFLLGPDVVNNLTETVTGKALDATQGKTLADLISTKLDKAASPNRNILHNWDFRNPINQRGQGSYSNTNYTIDRWKWASPSSNFITTINSGHVKLENIGSGTGYFEQPMEGNLLDGEYTISVQTLDGTIHHRNVLISNGIPTSGFDVNQVYIYLADNAKLSMELQAGGTISIKAIKLELGSVSTLANDPPADYGEQLALCQRYQLKFGAIARYRACQITSNIIDFFIPTPTTIRVNPTINTNAISVVNLTGTTQTGFTFTTHNAVDSLNGFVIRCTKTGHGITDAILSINTGTIIDANL